MINQEVKGTLAKLLATENLTVEHRKVSTACFDVEKRLLILPIWKTASNTVYDLLVGHEVGHALYTPNDPFGDAPQAFVNVIEDARIERLMKETYPGLRKSFFDGYAELWNDDFFGVKHEELENLPLIDRINLYFKGNRSMPFQENEQHWVDKVGATKTFQDVVDLANEMYGHAEKIEDAKPKVDAEDLLDDLENAMYEEGEEGEGQGEEIEREIDINSQGSSTNPTPSSDSSDANSSEDSQPVNTSRPSGIGGNQMTSSHDETKSITEEALSQALETLIDEDAREWVYLTLPKVNIDKIIIPHEKVQEDLRFFFYGQAFADKDALDHHMDNLSYAVNHFEKYKKDAQKSVNYLLKQFEMRKSADEYKRAATSKTGVINTNTLYKYKLTDDIFKKVTVVPEGKNHGLVMYLDWSGSMNHQLLDTVKQVFNLVWFCRKAQIPFRVYAFQSGYSYGGYGESKMHEGVTPKANSLTLDSSFKLFEFLSSRQNKRSLDESMKLLYTQAFAMNGYRLSYSQEYGLGGTPLAEAMMCTRQIVAELKRLEGVTKVNVVCLTDGESNPMSYMREYREHDDGYYYRNDEFRISSIQYSHGKVFFLRDPETGYTRKISVSPYETTQTLVSYMREITDYNWVGIRICSKGELMRLVRSLSFEEDFAQNIDKQWKKEKFASIKEKAGFTESFYIPDRGTGYGTEDLEVKTKGEVATKAELQRAFKKHMGSKMTNKTILNAFIEQVA